MGFAISVGIQLKNLPTGPGDKLSLDATYADGATKYLIGGVTGNNFDKFSGDTTSLALPELRCSVAADGVYTTGGSIEKTKGWGFRGAYVHNWTPNWETSVFGSYTNIDYNATLQLASALRSCTVCAGQRHL
jgi:hypothetical protein